MPAEVSLDILIWLFALACVALIAIWLLRRGSASQDTSAERLALLVGAHRAFGESDASLRRRSIALSRWPYKEDAPELAWWGRALRRIWPRRGQ